MEEYNVHKRNKKGYIDIGFTSDAEDSWFFEGFHDIWKIEEALFDDGYFYNNEIHFVDLNSILRKAIPITYSPTDMRIMKKIAGEWGGKIAKIDFNTYASDVGLVVNHFPGVIFENEVITKDFNSDFYQYLLIEEGLVETFKNWLQLILNEIIEARKININ
jgi:hypothetical protein